MLSGGATTRLNTYLAPFNAKLGFDCFAYSLRGFNGVTRLTNSKHDVFKRTLKLQTNQEIAHERNISVNTVEPHLKNIKRKLGTSKRSDFYLIATNNINILPRQAELQG